MKKTLIVALFLLLVGALGLWEVSVGNYLSEKPLCYGVTLFASILCLLSAVSIFLVRNIEKHKNKET